MNKMWFLEKHITYLWPIQRIFSRSISKRCNNCIISEKCSHLENGLCAECRQQIGPATEAAVEDGARAGEAFHQIMHDAINTGPHEYDALMMLSGGKDSAYILHRVVKEYPTLRVLCLTVNNGFTSPVAIKNAQFICNKLCVDILVDNSHIERFKSEFRKAFLNLRLECAYKAVDYVDGSLIFEIGKELANRMKIPLLIGGLSWAQVQKIVGSNDFKITETGQPCIIFPLCVWRTDEQEIRRDVVRLELIPPGEDSPLVSNNSLILPMSVIDILVRGYCSFEPEFAALIRQGKTSRAFWLHVFEFLEHGTKKGWFNKEVNDQLTKLELRITDIVEDVR